MWTDIAVSLGVLGIILAGLAVSLAGFRTFNHYQLTRQRCMAAAQAQLDSIAATGKPIDDEDFRRLWPKLSVSIDRAPGTGQWRNLELVEATATGISLGKQVKVKLSRYISDRPRRPQDTKDKPASEEGK